MKRASDKEFTKDKKSTRDCEREKQRMIELLCIYTSFGVLSKSKTSNDNFLLEQ